MTYLIFSPVGGESCPDSVGREPEELPRLGNNWANLMINNAFSCDGNVTKFKYYRGTATGTAYVGIWRQTGDRTFVLLSRTVFAPTGVGIHTIVPTTPIPVKKGDFVGIHYSQDTPTAAIANALQSDGAIPENELYQTYNADVFDEQIELSVPVDLSRYNGGIMRRTYALKTYVQYAGRKGNLECQQPHIHVVGIHLNIFRSFSHSHLL